MDSVLYIWLVTAAIAPFVTLFSTWSLVVFFSYRRRWRLADVFLCSLTAHEVIFSLFGFGFAVLSIISPLLDTPCSFIVWGLAGCRIFHLSALTSLLLDLALSSKFPYTYRYSVRKSQVQYHLAVLGIIAVFVGVTAVFARAPPSVEGLCSLHPLAWNFRFSVFLTSVYGMLLVTGFVCCFIVAVAKGSAEASYSSPGMNWESGRSSSSSNSSKALKGEDDEWKTVAAVCWLSYIVNHVPFLSLNIMGIVAPTLWSPWIDNVTVWMSLAQGTLAPLLLLLADVPHRSAVRNMLRQPGRIYRHLSDSSGFLLQVADVQCAKAGAPPPMMMYPSKLAPMHNVLHVPQRIRWTPNTLASLQSLNLDNRQSAALFCSSVDSLSRTRSPLGRDIYSSLDSSCYTLLSLRSSSSRMSSRNSVSSKKPAGDEDCVSITTNALDDFEFHGGQKSGCDQEPSEIFSITNMENPETQCCSRNSNAEPRATDSANKQNEKTAYRKSDAASFYRSSDSNAETANDADSFGVPNKNNAFGVRYSDSFIPDFSSNNLVFLSPKPLHARCLSIGSSEIRSIGEKTVTETPASLPCLEHSATRCGERPLDGYAQLDSRISTSNGSVFPFSDLSFSDQRLITYSEYL